MAGSDWAASTMTAPATFRSIVATGAYPDDPVKGLAVQDYGGFEPPDGWIRVNVHAAALNHHDVWTLRGRTGAKVPMVLGTDAAGVTEDGREVIVHAVVGPGETLSERVPGTLSEVVFVPAQNCVPKPAELTFEEAACLPTAWLTAYNMLFGKAQAVPGEHVLIQGAGGGVSTAAIVLAKAGGLEVSVTSRSPEKLGMATELGAHHVFTTGQQLPDKVDVVIDTVGEATWAHSLDSTRRGGRIVTAGATSGSDPSATLRSLFMQSLTVLGAHMGTPEQLGQLARFLVLTGRRPRIDSVWRIDDAAQAVERMLNGDVFGKIVIRFQ